jgi:predicted regulator of Ras-like GTPase activity (Roadblock/LC7/MglB family)
VIWWSLVEINKVAGVTGSFVSDNSGRVIASSFSGDVDMTSIRGVAREVVQTSAVLSVVQEPVGELDFAYARSRVVARDLDDSVLVVLCDPGADIPMLRMTLNVAATELRDDAELKSSLRDSLKVKQVLESELDELSWQLLKVLEREEPNDA